MNQIAQFVAGAAVGAVVWLVLKALIRRLSQRTITRTRPTPAPTVPPAEPYTVQRLEELRRTINTLAHEYLFELPADHPYCDYPFRSDDGPIGVVGFQDLDGRVITGQASIKHHSDGSCTVTMDDDCTPPPSYDTPAWLGTLPDAPYARVVEP